MAVFLGVCFFSLTKFAPKNCLMSVYFLKKKRPNCLFLLLFVKKKCVTLLEFNFVCAYIMFLEHLIALNALRNAEKALFCFELAVSF